MKYLLIVMTETIDDPVAEADDIETWVERHDASGAREFGDRLADAAEARTIRIRRDGSHVDEGPASDAHYAIAGIDILDCASLDEAVDVALGHPMARAGVLEVRPFFDWDAE